MGEAGADHFFDESGGQRLVDRELDGALGEFVGLQIGFELLNDGGGGEERAVVGEGGEPDDDLFVFEGWYAVADDLSGFSGKGGADGGAEFLEGGALRLWDGGEVIVDGGGRVSGAGWFSGGSRFAFHR